MLCTAIGFVLCDERGTIDAQLLGQLVDVEHQHGVVMDMREHIPAPLEKLRASLGRISIVSRMERLRHV